MDLQLSHRLLLDRIARKAQRAHYAVLEEGARLARQRAPVRTGYMRDHISAQDTTTTPSQISGELRSDAPYSKFVNDGTERQVGQPFMSEAIYWVKSQGAKQIADGLK